MNWWDQLMEMWGASQKTNGSPSNIWWLQSSKTKSPTGGKASTFTDEKGRTTPGNEDYMNFMSSFMNLRNNQGGGALGWMSKIGNIAKFFIGA